MSQLHINAKEIEILDKLANYNSEQYKILIKFAETASVERLSYRVSQFYAILSLVNDKKLNDFETLLDLETYILDNAPLYKLATSDISLFKTAKLMDRPEYEKAVNQLFTKYVSQLTGSTKDKIISLINKVEKENRYSAYTFRTLLENLITWYKNIALFKFFKDDIEKMNTLAEFNTAIGHLKQKKNAHALYKMIKPEPLKNVDIRFFYDKFTDLKKDIKFYIPVIEQSHKYTNIDDLFSDMKGMEFQLAVKETMDIIEKNKIRLIEYNAEKMIMIIHVETFNQIKQIGAKAWCLSNHKSDWDSYTRGNHFVMYLQFKSKPADHYSHETTTEASEMYGICINQNSLKIETCQNKYNSSCRDSFKFTPDELNMLKQHFATYKHSELKTNQLGKNVTTTLASQLPSMLPMESEKKKNIFNKIFS